MIRMSIKPHLYFLDVVFFLGRVFIIIVTSTEVHGAHNQIVYFEDEGIELELQ